MGPSKEFQHERAGAELVKRRNGGMAEGAVSLPGDPGEIRWHDGLTDERTQHFDRDLGVRAGRQTLQW